MAAVMMTGGPGGDYVDDDGYFTCAVSVQHKKHETETSSAGAGGSESDCGRRVVWPAPGSQTHQQPDTQIKTFQNAFKQSSASSVTQTTTQQVDQPHKWLQQGEAVMEAGSGHRVSRSRSKSRNIMERARSFERAAAESSRPASRNGSHHRSPSANKSNMEDMWMSQLERPGSRTDVDSRRFDEIGRVQTTEWEQRIKGSMESLPVTKTPPPKRREINMKRNPDLDRNVETRTPEPPPPPTRMTYPPNTIRDSGELPEFPPPPVSDGSSKLSEESVGQISEENKENIVKQWVESTTKSAEEIAKELEKFAYDIAETVVTNMERSSEKKEIRAVQSGGASTSDQMHQSLYNEFWEKQASISSTSHLVSESQYEAQEIRNNITNENFNNQIKKSASGSGLYFATPAHTTRHELHGPIYVQEDNKRVGMTFQQEERRREEMRKAEEAKQEERRRIQLEEEQRRSHEEEAKRLEEERHRQEIEIQRQEMERQRQEMERQKQEMERQRQEMERQQMLEKKRAEEQRKAEEERQKQQQMLEKKRLEEQKRAEEERLRELELKRQEEEMKRQELLRYEQLKREEEVKRQEEMRLEQEMRKQYEIQQQKLKMEQEQKIIQQQKEIASQQQNASVRDHIPKIPKNRTFEASQERSEAAKHEDHLLAIKTGQVKEKRNFWMRSSSVDRLNPVSSLSPAPRRRRIDWNANKQKENDDPESRPGSSLGQANTGSVRNLSSGFLAKSKSSAAIGQDETVERGRPKQRTLIQNGWTKEKYDQELKQEFFKSQELKTNKVNDTVQTWGKKESGTVSGRSTPAPSRHIGETFTENRVAKTVTENKSANAWRTKTPEPTLKLVNVSVEKSPGSNQNIHISENAQKQMASYVSSSSSQREEMVTMNTNTMSSQSSHMSHMSTSSKHSGENQINYVKHDTFTSAPPPPAPERNQSYGGKCENENTCSAPSVTDSTQTVTTSEAATEMAAQCTEDASVTKCPANIEQSVTESANAVSHQSHISHVLQNSTSTQSINSVLSTCSSNALPLPVKAGWYEENEAISVSTPTSTVSMTIPPDSGVLSPTKTGKTPVPVVANWFENLESKFSNKTKPSRNDVVLSASDINDERKSTIQSATSDLDDILDELIEADLELGANKPELQGKGESSSKKTFLTDDADNISLRSDVTVIENQTQPADEPAVVSLSLQDVPQSPKEIRKKFQATSSFEKSFSKSSDIELSKEFKEGVKGKVRESRDNFLRQVTQNSKHVENKSNTNELQQIKLHRTASQGNVDSADNDKFAENSAKQAKLLELEAVKRSRSRSRAADEEDLVHNSYSQEKRERELELLQLANRNANMTWQPENEKELQIREDREKELAELAHRSLECTVDDMPEDKTFLIKEERRRELESISDQRNDYSWETMMQEEQQESVGQLSELEISQQIWNERAEELRQMANIRPKSPWRPKSRETTDSPVNRVRSTAAAWREREKKSESRERVESPALLATPTPTRRIGNLFNRDPDYWNLNDEDTTGPTSSDFPDPPGEECSEPAAASPIPAAPLRQSSKGKIEEYSRDSQWNAAWRRC